MIFSENSLLLLQSYAPKICVKRFVYGVVCFVFITITTHLILMEPSFHRQQNILPTLPHNLVKRSFSEKKTIHHNQSSLKNCHNFIVYNADVHPGKLSFLQNRPTGWCVVVINLNDSKRLATCVDCVVLRNEWMYSHVVKFIENKFDARLSLSYSQLSKMAAYIYVLLQKPKWIFVTDRNGPIPYHAFKKITGSQIKTGPVYQGPEEIFEPCSHFIDPVTWKEREGRRGQGRYNIKVVGSHPVYSVMNSCSKSGMNPEILKESFDTEAPIPYIMPGTFGAVDFNNILVSSKNAWMLVASVVTNTGRKLDNEVLFNGSNINSISTTSTTTTNITISDMNISKNKNNNNINSSSNNNNNNSSSSSSSLVSNALQQSIHINLMVQRMLWETDATIGFVPGKSGGNACPSCDVFSEINALDEKYRHALLNWRCDSFQDVKSCFVQLASDRTISNESLETLIHAWMSLLVSHIPILDYVYGRHFKHILYCSESTAEFEQRYQRLHPDKPVSWIEIKHYMGYWGQNCMSAAIKMGYDVTGYLQISDDVILNVWNLDKLPFDQPWFQSNMRVAHIDHDIVPDVWINNYWWPWSQFSGKRSAVEAYKHLEAFIAHPVEGDRISSFMENLYNITNCNRCFLYEASDIFYLPSELGANFTFFSDIFSHNRVFLEITIPTVLAGITSDKEVYRLRGNYLWFHDRDRYPYVYTEFDHYYHAWKLSRFGDAREVQFFCRHFLTRVDKHLMMKGRHGS